MSFVTGVENPGLDLFRKAPLAIGLPFTPTVGCRIDFKNIHIEDLTSSSMAGRHLVLSAVKTSEETPSKRPNLSVISEEAVDISRELNLYQLEIENSMNEAKAVNNRDDEKANSSSVDSGGEANIKIVVNQEAAHTYTETHSCHETSNGQNACPKSSTPKTPNENCIATYSLDRSPSVNENPDVIYEEVSESQTSYELRSNDRNNAADDEVFKNPAPFVRTYRRDVKNKPSAEPMKILTEKQMDEKLKDSHEVFGGIRSSIRKSIRKFIGQTTSVNANDATPTREATTNNLLTTIRHSLRRKQPKQPLATSTPRQSLNEISIIDTSVPRAIFKDTAFSARLSYDDKNLLRPKNNLRSSFRRSKHAVKSVFKKNSE